MGTAASPRLHISHSQRRARLASRHHLGRTTESVERAVSSLVALHSTDPVSPHLSLWARVNGYCTAHLDDAICETRTLWRTHAMRRTLFVVPAAEGAMFEAAASRAIARRERRRVEQWLEAEMDPAEVLAWLADIEGQTLAAITAAGEASTSELSRGVPDLATEVTLGSGKWKTRAPLSSRVLFLLAMEGRITRTRPAGSWRSSQYRWAAFDAWFGDGLEPMNEAEARLELARRYLGAFGPVTTTDLRWWTGWTARQSTAALAGIGAVEVELDGPGPGWILPDDVDDVEDPPSSVALLPGLDATTMGWKERDWYLGGHAERLFDRNGNAGPTVWVNGAIVGGWGQRPDGEVVFELLEPVDDEAVTRIKQEAAALTAWLDGTVVSSRFPVPLERELSGR